MQRLPGLVWHKKDYIKMARALESEAYALLVMSNADDPWTKARHQRYDAFLCSACVLREVAKLPPLERPSQGDKPK
jgi:hypothetical protein